MLIRYDAYLTSTPTHKLVVSCYRRRQGAADGFLHEIRTTTTHHDKNEMIMSNGNQIISPLVRYEQ